MSNHPHYEELRSQLTNHSAAALTQAKEMLRPGRVISGQWGPVSNDAIELAKRAAAANLLLTTIDELEAEDSANG